MADQIGNKLQSDPMQILIRSHANFDPIDRQFFPIRSPKIFAINRHDYTACNCLKFHAFLIVFYFFLMISKKVFNIFLLYFL